MHNRTPSSIVFLLFLSFASISLTGQDSSYAYKTLGNLEDYSHIQTQALHQDSRGLIWIGTFRGLDRWDGVQIVSYPSMPFDSLAIPARGIYSITSDDQNNLWLLGENLIKFDLESELFTPMPLLYDTILLHPNYIQYDPSGFLWLESRQGVFRYYPRKDSLGRIPIIGTNGAEILEYWTECILYDSTGLPWMLDRNNGLFWYDNTNDVFRQQSLALPDLIDGPIRYSDLKAGPGGDLWILGAKAELVRLNPYTRSAEWIILNRYKNFSPNIRGGMALDKQGRIWFGIDQGVMLYDPVSDTLSAVDLPYTPTMVTCMVTDIQGNILIGSLNGVKMVDEQRSKLRTISMKEQLLSEGVDWLTCVIRDKQMLCMGTFQGGLIIYDLKNNRHFTYNSDGKPGSLASDWLVRILKDRNQRIWIMSGWNGNLQRYEPESNSFEEFIVCPSRMITQDDDGIFWILDLDRLLHFDPITLDTSSIHFRKPLPVLQLKGQFDHIPFIRDKEGIFWFAQQDGGLYRIDPESGNWTHYNHDPDHPEGLPDFHVRDLFCDSNGRIWLSTWAGLSRIIPDDATDTALIFDNHYITKLKLGQTTRITEDKQGNIWVGTFTGVVVLKTDGTIEKYTFRDGLPEDPEMIWALNSDPENGKLYMGCVDVVIVPPDYLSYNEYIPPIQFTAFSLGNQLIKPGPGLPLEKSILFADHIDLDHDQNFFRIDFAAMNYSQSERNQYRYFLNDVDQDTVYSGNKSFAEYTDLSSGKYTFWATGSNNNGLWNLEGKSITLRIHPPWHRTAIAFIIYFLFLAAFVYAFIRFRTYRLRQDKMWLEKEVDKRTLEIHKKNQQIIEMENLRTRFFTDISHEIRTPLTLITGPLENLIQEKEQTERSLKWLSSIKRNSQRLLQLVNQLLDIARLDMGQMKLVLEYSDVLKHLRILVNGYHSLAETNRIRLLLDIPADEMKQWIDKDKIEKVTANLLSNALKYTPEHGIVTCRIKILTGAPFTAKRPALRIMVADSGPGIAEHEKSRIFDRFYRSEKTGNAVGGTGMGLSVISELLKLLHGEITLKSMEGKGSAFLVTIPLGKDHLTENEFIIREQEQPVPAATDPADSGRSTPPGEAQMNRDLSLLIIEDNDEVRSFLKESLEARYVILEARDGIRGHKMATSEIPDLIITDVMMPAMDGFELCKKLKNDERTSHIPIIMITARALRQDKMEGLETGADDYIIKPFRVEEISVRIRNLIDQRERLREKYSSYIRLNLGELNVTTLEDRFLKKVTGLITENLHDFNFDVGTLQEKMNMSSSNLYRKLKVLTGESPVQLIKIMRLKLAATLMKKNKLSITEVMLQVGFSNQSYFSRSFKELYGTTPKAYQKTLKKH